MCTRPITHDGKTFACRSCDDCISTRRAQWEARAMMEKQLHPFTLAIALTYDESDEHNRDARQMFQYADFRAFMHRLRAAAREENPDAYVRFILAGEQGDRYGACHWHAIIYSNVDPCSLGVVKRLVNGKRRVEKDRREMMTQGSRKRRLNWSLWKHGFATFQDPDYGGVHYVLSYCLADQFTEEKSRDTMREAKSANFSTGLFRMSKRPAIGEPWLWAKFEVLDARGDVLPHLNFKVPGMSSYYHPSGAFREKILWSLRALNTRARLTTGRDAPQWSTLLAACSDNLPDMEILIGPISQLDDDESPELALERELRGRKGEAARREHARKCGGSVPCGPCLSSLDDEDLAAIGCYRWQEDSGDRRVFVSNDPADEAKRKALHGGGVNRFCQARGSRLSRLTFPATDDIRLGAKGRGNL